MALEVLAFYDLEVADIAQQVADARVRVRCAVAGDRHVGRWASKRRWERQAKVASLQDKYAFLAVEERLFD